MALPTPYWLLPNPNRGTAKTLSGLPAKIDIEWMSTSDFDHIFTIYLLEPDGSVSTEPDDTIEDNFAEMTVFEEVGGVLTPVDSLTSDNGRLIVGAGTVRAIILAATLATYPANTYYVLALTDAIPRQRVKLAGMILLIDRLPTRAS